MSKCLLLFVTVAVLCTGMFTALGQPVPSQDADLLQVRETVWRSWFANDAALLNRLVPPETIVISAGEEKWKHRREVLQAAAAFHNQGGRLVHLSFPRTEVQHFGDVAIVYSEYITETEMRGKHSVSKGRATEIFVRRDGHWTNPGWHTDDEK